ncbi:MAG: hypothetical protein RLY40_659 [Pseudomonadota bacterium]|jgi:hypothetical protein
MKTGSKNTLLKKNMTKKRQNDLETSWTLTLSKTYYDYKTHITINIQYKRIHAYEVTAET